MIHLVKFRSQDEWSRLKEEFHLSGIKWWKVLLVFVVLLLLAVGCVLFGMKVGFKVAYDRGVDDGYSIGLKHGGDYGVQFVRSMMDESIQAHTVLRFEGGKVYQVKRLKKNIYCVAEDKARQAELLKVEYR